MIQTQTPDYANASAEFAAGSADAFGLAVPIVIVLGVVCTLLLSTTVYRALLNWGGRFAMSVEYALKGVVTSVFLAIIVTPLYLLSQLSASDKWLLVEAASVIIVGYVGLVTMGMVGEIVWRRVKAQHERVTGHTPFENWGEETDD